MEFENIQEQNEILVECGYSHSYKMDNVDFLFEINKDISTEPILPVDGWPIAGNKEYKDEE